MKTCTKCSTSKPLGQFQVDERYRGGRKNWCVSCINEYKRAWRAENPERTSYEAMIDRCYNESNPRYSNYGGRGVLVCDRWLNSFDDFLADMGARPQGCSIDRINVDGNYEPENCRWATPLEQGNNRTNNRLVEYDGKMMTAREWERSLGFTRGAIYNRLKAGWTVEEAMTTPMRMKMGRKAHKK